MCRLFNFTQTGEGVPGWYGTILKKVDLAAAHTRISVVDK
jgi:hypothetical protein